MSVSYTFFSFDILLIAQMSLNFEYKLQKFDLFSCIMQINVSASCCPVMICYVGDTWMESEVWNKEGVC